MLKISPLLFLLMVNSSFADGKKTKDPMGFTKSKGHELPKEVVDMINKMEMNVKTVGNKRIESMDNNKDGKIDSEMTFINNKLFTEKIDFNGDGIFDKTDWYFQSGDIFHTTTIDSNYNGNVDVKIVRTFKHATKGNYKKIVYRDNNHDGKFDSKKTEDVEGHQKGVATRGNSEDCSDCSIHEYSRMHLPGILDARNRSHLRDLVSVVKREGIRNFLKAGAIQFDLKIQNSCQHEGSDADKELFAEVPVNNISNALKSGLECLGKLAHDGQDEKGRRRIIHTQSGVNFRKAIGGLAGFGVNEENPGTQPTLSLVCKLPDNQNVSWTESHGGKTVDAFALATSYLDPRGNRFSGVADAPNIVFSPNLASRLDNHWRDEYPGQTRLDRFKELVFHEFLHTSLGTTHADNEVDYAQACGDYCFHRPSSEDEKKIQKLSKRICEGEFGAGFSPGYQRVRDELRSLRATVRSQTK